MSLRIPAGAAVPEFTYDFPVPRVRCTHCLQGYDLPPAVALRLPSSIAACSCGEYIAGGKAAILSRLMNPDEIEELDLTPYKITETPLAASPPSPEDESGPFDFSPPRSIRIIARGKESSVDETFTIDEHPLYIGRKGCHVAIEDAELSIRHCSLFLRRGEIFVRDEGSHSGTFLDGEPVEESAIGEGVHLIRAGTALISLEPTAGTGSPVGPIALGEAELLDATAHLRKKLMMAAAAPAPVGNQHLILVCIEGPLKGNEFEIPPGGLVIGREGTLRVPDEFLSRQHFEVAPDASGVLRVRDLGSRNGTFLNSLLAKNTKVSEGDEIMAGETKFRVEAR